MHPVLRKAAAQLVAMLLAICLLSALSSCGCDNTSGAASSSSVGDDAALEAIPYEELDIDADSPVAYYYQNADVFAIQDAATSPNTLGEVEAVATLSDRGFSDVGITTHYDQDGALIDETEISELIKTTHPSYTTYYEAASGDYWTVYLIDGDVMATPLTYVYETAGTEAMVSENDYITSYDGESKRFLRLKPNDGSCEIYTVDRIDAAALDELSAGRFKVN